MFIAHNTPPPVTDSAYHYNRSYVLRVLARRCGWLDSTEREAVLHDAYVVLLEKSRNGALDTGGMEDAQIRAYLTRTALHKALDERKSAWRRLSVALEHDEDALGLPSPEQGVEDQVLAREELAELHALVDGLPTRRRTVLTLRYFADRTPTEIQSGLGVTARVYRRELERGVRAVKAGFTAVN